MIKPHILPDTEALSDEFSVMVDGTEIKPCTVTVSAMPFNRPWPGHNRPLDQTEKAYFVGFSMEKNGTAEVEVTPKEPFGKAVVRPFSKNIKCIAENGTVKFRITAPGQYDLQLDGLHRNLYVFADEPIEAPGEDVLYYGKGVHNVGVVELKSGQTVFIDDGAVVYGAFYAVNSENITIKGNGIIDGSFETRYDDTFAMMSLCHLKGYEDVDLVKNPEKVNDALTAAKALSSCIKFYNCKNVTVDGVILRDACAFVIAMYGSDGIVINNVKNIGMYKYNTDGFDLVNCANARITGCFLRNFDDCIVLKGSYGWQSKIIENILVENCIVWCDWGAALEIGAETTVEEIRNIRYKNCDIIYGANFMRIQNRGRAYVHHISYENISCEVNFEVPPFDIQETDEAKYERADMFNIQEQKVAHFSSRFVDVYQHDIRHGHISDVTVKNLNVYVEEGLVKKPVFELYGGTPDGAGGENERIVFDGITVNGRKADVENDFDIWQNEYTDVKFM